MKRECVGDQSEAVDFYICLFSIIILFQWYKILMCYVHSVAMAW